jgi:hypothetical protein
VSYVRLITCQNKNKACEAITNGLLSVAERGELKNRDDVIKTLEMQALR